MKFAEIKWVNGKYIIISRTICKYGQGLVYNELGEIRSFYTLDVGIDPETIPTEGQLFELCETYYEEGGDSCTAIPLLTFERIK